ncbi:MAG: hypothetical protein IT462_14160 [Planctomycetes bacterium]|nr:hypothetical protein [Planctomycetota bacterium]
MSRLCAALLLALVVSACGGTPALNPEDCGIANAARSPDANSIDDVKPWGDPPGEAFEARAAFTVTIEKLDKPGPKGEAFGYFFGGSATPQSRQALHVALLRYAKFRSEKNGHPGWMAKGGYSENVVAVRCDPQAPWALLGHVHDSATDAKMYHMAIARRDAFKESDYARIGKDARAILTELGEPYYRITDETSGVVGPPVERINVCARANSGQTEIVLSIGGRARRVVADTSADLKAISPEMSADEAGKAKAKSAREHFTANVAQAVENFISDSGAKVESIELEGMDPLPLNSSTDPKSVELGFAFALLDAVKQVNANLRAAGKAELRVRLRGFVPIPPEPDLKPEEEVVYPKEESMPDEKPIEETPDDK